MNLGENAYFSDFVRIDYLEGSKADIKLHFLLQTIKYIMPFYELSLTTIIAFFILKQVLI